MQDSEVLFPPSPNWFSNQTFHSREEDSLLAVASFRTIIIYQISLEVKLPKIIRSIPHLEGKVNGVRLHNSSQHEEYGMTVATTGESNVVNLYNIITGKNLGKHQEHKQTITGITWAEVRGDNVLVTIGGGGQIVIWNPKENLRKVHILSYFNNLTLIEPLPHKPDQALIAADKVLVHVSLKDGGVLHQFKGHDHDVYSLTWYPSGGSPFEEQVQSNVQPEHVHELQDDVDDETVGESK